MSWRRPPAKSPVPSPPTITRAAAATAAPEPPAFPGPSVSLATHASVRFFTVDWLICFSAL